MESTHNTGLGEFRGKAHYYPLRIFYEDTDASGIVYHANYLKYCERARSSLVLLLGIDQRAAMEEGLGHYAVADLQMRFLSPAKLNDSLVVQTQCHELRAASVVMVQNVMRGAEVLVELTIRVAFVSLSGKPCRQPAAWRAAFAEFESERE